MIHFAQTGTTFRSTEVPVLHQELPANNYVLKCNDTGFFLTLAEEFKLPEKIYGNCQNNSHRILTTFKDRGRNTGVLFVGEKGSGKSLLMRKICIDSNLPVIIINNDFVGDEFNSFLSSINQPAIILFDEYDKIYNNKQRQERLLTLLDGTYQSNKLFIFTSNSKYNLESNMKNRPGRIFYMFEFKGLEEQFIIDYCNDNLIDKTKISRIVSLSNFFSEFNFDMLASIVEEVNRYGEDPGQLLTVLNIRPEDSSTMQYDVQLQIGNIVVPTKDLYRSKVKFNPFLEELELTMYLCWNKQQNPDAGTLVDNPETPCSYYVEMLEKNMLYFGRRNEMTNTNSFDYRGIVFNNSDIIRTDGNTIVYENEQGFIATIVRSRSTNSLDYAYSTF
jgi:GTP-binding protein EngB required for normal cell division